MSALNTVIFRARAAMRDDGTLDSSELTKLLQAALDETGRKINREFSQAALYARWHFWSVADAKARETLTGFAEATLKDDFSFYFWAADVFSPGGELEAPPGSPPVPKVDQDRRFLGRWNHTTHLSNGGSSMSIVRYRAFGRDGRFADSNRSSAAFKYFSADGDWTGTTDAMTELSPSNSGRWATAYSNLWLRFDSGRTELSSYEIHPDSLLLGKDELWTRR